MALSKGDIEAFNKLRAEKDALATTLANLDRNLARVTKERDDAQSALKKAPTVGHNLTDDICRQIAEKAARATLDAILSALGATRRQATPAEEAERIARMTPKIDDTPVRARALDTDDGENFGPVASPDGSPTPATLAMLTPAGRMVDSAVAALPKRSSADILKRLK